MTNPIQTIITGKVLNAKCATFKDDNGNDVAYGKIQLEVPDMSGDFLAIQNIKVRTEHFGSLPNLADKAMGKVVKLNCSTSNYNGKTSYYFESVSQ